MQNPFPNLCKTLEITMGNNTVASQSPPPPQPLPPIPPQPPPHSSFSAAADDTNWSFVPMIAALGENPGTGTAVPALQAVCDSLMLSSDDQLESFPVEMAAKFLVEALRSDGLGEENILAARGIFYLCDSITYSTDTVVECGAIAALCACLHTVDYMELAEECVKALEMISCEDPVSCLESGAVMAVLNIINFCPINTMRTALNMVDNTCECCIGDDASMVIDAVKVLCTLLKHQDPMVANTAASSMAKFARSFRGSSYFFDELCKCGVINIALDVIALNGLLTHLENKNDLAELLTIAALCSTEVIKTLFELNFSSILTKFLLQIPCHAEENYEQVHAFLSLASAVIPPIAKDDQDIQLMLDKEKIIRDEPKFLLQFATDTLPFLIKLTLTMKFGANMEIIYGCTCIVNDVIYFIAPEKLLFLVEDIDISRFLAHLLTFKNRHILVSTLNIIQNLIVKLPKHFLNSFVKEGVVDAVDALSLDCSKSAHKSNNQSEEAFTAEVNKCFCYAFDSHQSYSSESESCRVGEIVLPALVNHIKTTYFPEELISKVVYNKTIQKIKASCADLRNSVDSSLTTGCHVFSEADLSYLLERVMQNLKRVDTMPVSSFIRSEILSTLVHYLSNGKFLLEHCSYNNLDDFSLLNKRFYTFSYLSLLKVDQNGESLFLKDLTRTLQDALSSFYLFPIIRCFYNPILQSIDIPARHSTMSPFLRVRFVSKTQTEVNDNENVLTVSISSSFEDIEQVLWRKNFCKRQHIYASLEAIGVQTAKPSITSESGTDKEQLMTESVSNKFSTFIIQNNGRTVFTTRITQESQQKFIFFMNGEELDRSLTLYQTILKFRGYGVGPELWNEVYTVTYTTAEEFVSSNYSKLSSNATKSSVSKRIPSMNWPTILQSSRKFADELTFKLEEADLVRDIFFMLKILESMNHLSCQILHSISKEAFARGHIERLNELKAISSSVTQPEFVNAKLTYKLERQMEDFLVCNTGAMPSWCTKLMFSFPFLVSFEAKCKYLRLNAFQSSSFERNEMPEDPLHVKFKANRNNILSSAEKMMSNYSNSKALIELEFDGEIGTGLGPTVEFYTLVSHEFQKLGLGMWREDCNSSSTQAYAEASRKSVSSGLVSTYGGLFPRPFSIAKRSSEGKKFCEVVDKFILLGQIIARAIKDQRILDLPLSRALSLIFVTFIYLILILGEP